MQNGLLVLQEAHAVNGSYEKRLRRLRHLSGDRPFHR